MLSSSKGRKFSAASATTNPHYSGSQPGNIQNQRQPGEEEVLKPDCWCWSSTTGCWTSTTGCWSSRKLDAAADQGVSRIRSSSPGMNRLILKSFWLHTTSPFILKAAEPGQLESSGSVTVMITSSVNRLVSGHPSDEGDGPEAHFFEGNIFSLLLVLLP